MGIRALAADVSIMCIPTLIIGHEFGGRGNPSRKTFPYKAAYNGNQHNNLYHAYYVISTDDEWQFYFKNLMDSDASIIESDELAKEDRQKFSSLRKKSSHDLLFTLDQLMYRLAPLPDSGGATLEPTALRTITATATGRTLELGTGSRKGTNAILVGSDEVVTVDHIEKYYNAAVKVYSDNPKVKAIHAPLKDGTYDLPEDLGQFDTIVIDGPPGSKARKATLVNILTYLKDGGKILIDDSKRDIKSITEWVHTNKLQMRHVNTHRGMVVINTPPPLPPLSKQISNFSHAVKKSLSFLISQNKLVATQDVRQYRFDMCTNCEHWSNGRCSKCGCGLSAKVSLDSEKCPIGKW